MDPWKFGDSYWKPSFPGSMLIFGGANISTWSVGGSTYFWYNFQMFFSWIWLSRPWWHVVFGEDLTCPERHLAFWEVIPFTQDARNSTRITPPKTNRLAPEKWWLEDYFPFGKAYFRGRTVSFREGIPFLVGNPNLNLHLWLASWVGGVDRTLNL